MEDEKSELESLKKLAQTRQLEAAMITDMTLKHVMKENDLTRTEAAELIAAWYVEEWADLDAEKGFSFEGPLSEGDNLKEICGMYAEHLVEGGQSIPYSRRANHRRP